MEHEIRNILIARELVVDHSLESFDYNSLTIPSLAVPIYDDMNRTMGYATLYRKDTLIYANMVFNHMLPDFSLTPSMMGTVQNRSHWDSNIVVSANISGVLLASTKNLDKGILSLHEQLNLSYKDLKQERFKGVSY